MKKKKTNDKKRFETDIKIFLTRKKKKKHQYHREQNKNISEEQKQNKVEYMKNYYLAHNK